MKKWQKSEQKFVTLNRTSLKHADYISYHQKKIASTNKILREKKNDVFLFGAHITAQYYQAFGLEVEAVKCIIDNDKTKHGRNVSGIELEIVSPQVISGVHNPYVILPRSPYAQEIKEQLLSIGETVLALI